MSTTEVRCLQTSTHLLGTVLHLDDVIGTFAGRQVAALSDSLAVTLLSVATRVAVTAALLFVEFGIVSMYSPIITGALIIGMYFYPVPEQMVAPIRPPLPPVGAPPAPLISGSLPDIIYPPEEPASPVRVPAPSTAPTTPAAANVSPIRPLSSSVTRQPRPDSLARRGNLFGLTPQATPGALLSTSMISQPSPREQLQSDMFRSVVVTSTQTQTPVLPRSHSADFLARLDLPMEDRDDDENGSSSSSSPPPSPPPARETLISPAAAAVTAAATSTLIHRRVAQAPSTPGSVVDHSIQSHQGAAARDFLIVLFTQALGDDLGPFFVNNMLPPNITSAEFNPATKNFLFTLSAPKEATISRVGTHAIAGVQGCSLRIHNSVHGTLDNDMRGITFKGESMQMGGTKMFVPYTVTLTGLRRNFNESITLKGILWSGNGDITGTPDQFRDTFSSIPWTA